MMEKARAFIDQHRRQPFFICFAINLPHYSYQGDAKWLQYYRNLPFPRRLYAAFRNQDRLQKTESQTKAEAQRMGAESSHKAHRLVAQGDTDVQHPETEEEVGRSQERERAAQAYSKHPALLRMLQL